MNDRVPELRVRAVNDAPVRDAGRYVLYWMTAQRRVEWNFSLERAVEWAVHLRKPLVVLEALRCDYRWACDRFHRFVIEGMAENARRLHDKPVRYYPYVERTRGEGKGLLAAMAAPASVVVADDYPCYFLPRMVAAAGQSLDVRLEAVDGNGLLPMRAADRAFTAAYHFRRFLQRELPGHLPVAPKPHPLARRGLRTGARIPAEVTRRWPPASARELATPGAWMGELPIDHGVAPAPAAGGTAVAEKRLARFLEEGLPRYAEDRNHPDRDATSGLSPYLHFGHLSAHRIFDAIARRQGWTPAHVTRRTDGKREGWWGMDPAAEAFLDQLVTWRELGFNRAAAGGAYDTWDSLPDWARATMEAHAGDRRADTYSLEEFEGARTHDRLWNAAQNELRREGRIHNYLRMLWGKKILEWSGNPRSALVTMIHLNDKYALDGRDPNSYSGIGWVLGRYDRPWAPERPIFGRIRYMSSENTARKVRVRRYLERLADRRSEDGG